jgi:hypothetical protein
MIYHAAKNLQSYLIASAQEETHAIEQSDFGYV